MPFKPIKGVIYRRRLIETSTGEILATEENGDRIKYTKSSSIKSYRKIKETKSIEKQKEIDECKKQVWEYDRFFKGNIREIQLTMEDLDVYEKAFLYSIVPFVGYEDCCLKYSNGTELDMNAMVRISGISKRKMQDVIKGLIDKDILYRGKNSKTYQYFVNPWLFCKGNVINKVLKSMFKNYKIKTLNNVMWKDLK